jgi:hypothetical protein
VKEGDKKELKSLKIQLEIEEIVVIKELMVKDKDRIVQTISDNNQ